MIYFVRNMFPLIGIVGLVNPAFINNILYTRATSHSNRLDDALSGMLQTGGVGYETYVFALVYTIACMKLLMQMRLDWQKIKLPKVFYAFLAMILLSTLWSTDKVETISRILFLSMKIGFLLWCFNTFGLTGIINRILIVTSLNLWIALLLVFISPDKVFMSYAGSIAFNGLFSHKTAMGCSCAIFLMLILFKTKLTFIDIVQILVFALALLMSKSLSALIFLLVFYALYVIRNLRNYRLRFILYVSFFQLIIIMLMLSDIILIAAGKEDLNGRLQTWTQILQFELPHYFGSGYYGFWRIEQNSDIFQFLLERGRYVASLHNGFLSALYDLGILGLILFLGLYIYLFLRSLKFHNQVGNFVFAFAFSMFAYSMMESSIYLGRQLEAHIFTLMLISASRLEKMIG